MFGIVILAVYAVLMIGVTLMFTRKTTDAEGFHVADRRIGSVIAAMSIAATWIWAPSLFTSSEMAYTRGIPGMFWFTVPNVLCLILFIPFAKRIRAQYPEGITLTGYMAERYHSGKVKGVYSFQLGALAVLSTAVQLLAGGKTLALITGLPFWSMTLALAAIAYSYSRFSGLKASIITDVIQLGIILMGGALLVVLSLRMTGGFDTVRAGLGAVSGEYTSLTSSTGIEVLLGYGLADGCRSDLRPVRGSVLLATSFRNQARPHRQIVFWPVRFCLRSFRSAWERWASLPQAPALRPATPAWSTLNSFPRCFRHGCWSRSCL